MSQLVELGSVSAQMVRRRLRRLEEAGLLSRVVDGLSGRCGRPESVFVPTREGLACFSELVGASEVECVPASVGHELVCNWVRLRVQALDGVEVVYVSSASPFCGEGTLSLGFRLRDGEYFVPDAAFALSCERSGKSLLFFVEVDMGTESLKGGSGSDIAGKVRNYRQFRALGGYRKCEKTFGKKFRGFRVLFVARSARRLKSLCRAVAAMPPSDFIWLAEFERIMDEGVGASVWFVGGRLDEPTRSIMGGNQ